MLGLRFDFSRHSFGDAAIFLFGMGKMEVRFWSCFGRNFDYKCGHVCEAMDFGAWGGWGVGFLWEYVE